MSIIDISRTLRSDIAVWPGDTPFDLAVTLDRRAGAAVNLTTLTVSAHTGTHVDAPFHFTDDGLRLDEVDLRPYWGPAHVVTVRRSAGPLTPADFDGVDWSGVERLLVHSEVSALDPAVFPQEYVYPTPELADFLGGLGIILYGADSPSMDSVDSKDLPGHHALLRNNIAILEGLALGQAPDGLYELVALPLKIGGGDGSPVRALLRPLAASGKDK
jgi:arylformamidase